MRGMAYRVYRPVSWPLELRSFSRPFRDYSTWGADPGAQAPGYSRKSLRDRTAAQWRATVPARRLGEFGANHREKIRAARQRSPTERTALRTGCWAEGASAVPFGTTRLGGLIPALKRRAILGSPFGTERRHIGERLFLRGG